MRILITFGVPQNTGDQALLESMCYLIEKKYPNSEIIVASDFPAIHIDSNLKIDHIWDYEAALFLDKNKLKQRILKILQMFSWKFNFSDKLKKHAFWSTSYTRTFFKSVNTADLIILAPGGYLNSYYDLMLKLCKIEKLLAYGKRIVIFGQSIGPIDLSHKNKFVGVIDKLDQIVVRERISRSLLISFGFKNIILGTDCAFILHEKYSALFKTKKQKSIFHIAMSVRNWKNDGVEIKEKFIATINYLFSIRPDLHITFLSTCQGYETYTDDSVLALEIAKHFDGNKYNILVNRNHYTPKQIIAQYQKYDLYIGMRMHGGILAMLSGTPALMIGYEQKSEGVLENISSAKYHFYYGEDIEVWKKNILAMMNNYEAVSKKLKTELEAKANLLNELVTIL